MNCRRFQNRLHEYVEGTLPAGTWAAAHKHLALCSACGQLLRQEQQLAHLLSHRLRHDAETLTLHPDVERRILAALAERIPSTDWSSIVWSWNRLAWPLAIAVSVLLIVTLPLINHFSRGRVHPTETTRSNRGANDSAVSILISYRVPIYRFRREGDLVVDTLSYETVVASETLWTGGQSPVQQEQVR